MRICFCRTVNRCWDLYCVEDKNFKPLFYGGHDDCKKFISEGLSRDLNSDAGWWAPRYLRSGDIGSRVHSERSELEWREVEKYYAGLSSYKIRVVSEDEDGLYYSDGGTFDSIKRFWYPASKLYQCEDCKKLGVAPKVMEWGFAICGRTTKHEDTEYIDKILCIGCQSKYRELSRKSELYLENSKLLRKLNMERIKCQKLQQQDN